MKRIHKGEYGYISYQKKWSVIRTVLFFAISLGIFAAGYLTTGTKKNLLTIVAVLGCLPASKSAVNAIMFCMAKGCSTKVYDIVSALNNKYSCLYDLYMTTYKKNYAISQLVIAEKTIVALTEDKEAVLNDIENHIQEHLKQDGVKDMVVKLYTDCDKYCERIKQLNELDFKPLKNESQILSMLIDISL